jgi:acyl carrier protein
MEYWEQFTKSKEMKMEPDKTKINIIIKSTLAEKLGVDTEDIQDEDSLSEDLHMNPADITDIIESLKQKGLDTPELYFSETDTVGELVEALCENYD